MKDGRTQKAEGMYADLISSIQSILNSELRIEAFYEEPYFPKAFEIRQKEINNVVEKTIKSQRNLLMDLTSN